MGLNDIKSFCSVTGTKSNLGPPTSVGYVDTFLLKNSISDPELVSSNELTPFDKLLDIE